ncbi:putative reverse transcriptase domain-containing protein [Tanacetum coccineum]
MDLMNRVCKPYLDKFFIMFIEDILIYSNSKEDHEVHMRLVLELLKKEELFAKFSKFEIWLQEVHFLGHVVNNNGIHMDPSKIKSMKNWKVPKTPYKIRLVLGFTGYCQRFIMNFSKIAKPFTSLTQNNQKYEWGMEQEEYFQILKDNLCTAPILSLPYGPDNFVVYCDTSNQGFGCVLMQRGKCSIKDKLLAAESETSKSENAPGEMLRSLDQQIEKKEDVLYGRKCRSHVLWTTIGESRLIRPELVQETTDKVVLIKERLKAARDRQKSYVGNRRKPLEFEVGDQVLLKVSPWKGVVRFRKKGKLAPRYVGPFEILERIGHVAYRLRLPQELSNVHDTFHVSNLKNCLADTNLHVPLVEIKFDKTLCFVEEPVEIIDREVKSLKHSMIPIVKVHWNSKRGPKDYMKTKYSHLFVE